MSCCLSRHLYRAAPLGCIDRVFMASIVGVGAQRFAAFRCARFDTSGPSGVQMPCCSSARFQEHARSGGNVPAHDFPLATSKYIVRTPKLVVAAGAKRREIS